jgi:hypothetical protein
MLVNSIKVSLISQILGRFYTDKTKKRLIFVTISWKMIFIVCFYFENMKVIFARHCLFILLISYV